MTPPFELLHLKPLIILVLFVCAAGILSGGFFGLLAVLLYLGMRGHSMVSIVSTDHAGLIGAGSGLIAAIVWCRIVIPRSIMQFRSNLASGGTMIGVLVGVVSAIILHVGLMYLAERIQIGSLIVGLVFGIIVGAVLGAVCGALCRVAVRAAWPKESPWTPESTDLQPQTDNPT